MMENKPRDSKWVQDITLDSGEELSIYRAENGLLFGIDGTAVTRVDDDEAVYEPYTGELQILTED